jgi:hypothetical protein
LCTSHNYDDCNVKIFPLLEKLPPHPPKKNPYTVSYSCYVTLRIHTAAMLHCVSDSCFVTLCIPSYYVTLYIHIAAILHCANIKLPCYTVYPHSCYVALCKHKAAMLHCASTQLLCCTTFQKKITLRTFLQQCITI